MVCSGDCKSVVGTRPRQIIPSVIGLPHRLNPTLHAGSLPECQPLGACRLWEDFRAHWTSRRLRDVMSVAWCRRALHSSHSCVYLGADPHHFPMVPLSSGWFSPLSLQKRWTGILATTGRCFPPSLHSASPVRACLARSVVGLLCPHHDVAD